jgi:hypothetical protein
MQPSGCTVERIRRDRILHEALTAGPDPLHLTLVFGISHNAAAATRPSPSTCSATNSTIHQPTEPSRRIARLLRNSPRFPVPPTEIP